MWITTLHLKLNGVGYVDCLKANYGHTRADLLIVFFTGWENPSHHI